MLIKIGGGKNCRKILCTYNLIIYLMSNAIFFSVLKSSSVPITVYDIIDITISEELDL